MAKFAEKQNNTEKGGWWCTKQKMTTTVFDDFIKWLDETDGKPTEYEIMRAKAIADLHSFNWDLLNYDTLLTIYNMVARLVDYKE